MPASLMDRFLIATVPGNPSSPGSVDKWKQQAIDKLNAVPEGFVPDSGPVPEGFVPDPPLGTKGKTDETYSVDPDTGLMSIYKDGQKTQMVQPDPSQFFAPIVPIPKPEATKLPEGADVIVDPETQIPVAYRTKEGQTKPYTDPIAAKTLEKAAGLAESLESPAGLLSAPVGAFRLGRAALGLGFGIPAAYQGAKEVYQGTALGDLPQALGGAIDIGVGVPMAVGGAGELFPGRAVTPDTPGAMLRTPQGSPAAGPMLGPELPPEPRMTGMGPMLPPQPPVPPSSPTAPPGSFGPSLPLVPGPMGQMVRGDMGPPVTQAQRLAGMGLTEPRTEVTPTQLPLPVAVPPTQKPPDETKPEPLTPEQEAEEQARLAGLVAGGITKEELRERQKKKPRKSQAGTYESQVIKPVDTVFTAAKKSIENLPDRMRFEFDRLEKAIREGDKIETSAIMSSIQSEIDRISKDESPTPERTGLLKQLNDVMDVYRKAADVELQTATEAPKQSYEKGTLFELRKQKRDAEFSLSIVQGDLEDAKNYKPGEGLAGRQIDKTLEETGMTFDQWLEFNKEKEKALQQQLKDIEAQQAKARQEKKGGIKPKLGKRGQRGGPSGGGEGPPSDETNRRIKYFENEMYRLQEQARSAKPEDVPGIVRQMNEVAAKLRTERQNLKAVADAEARTKFLKEHGETELKPTQLTATEDQMVERAKESPTDKLEEVLTQLNFHLDQLKYGLRTERVTREMEARWKADWEQQKAVVEAELARRKSPLAGPGETPRTESEPIGENPFMKAMRRSTKRILSEQEGQGILDDAQDAGRSPAQIGKEFFENVYPNLDPAAKARLDRFFEGSTGFKLGEIVGFEDTPQGRKMIPAKSWLDTMDLSTDADDISNLEGTDRGLVAVMEYGNKNFKGRAKLPPAGPGETPRTESEPPAATAEGSAKPGGEEAPPVSPAISEPTPERQETQAGGIRPRINPKAGESGSILNPFKGLAEKFLGPTTEAPGPPAKPPGKPPSGPERLKEPKFPPGSDDPYGLAQWIRDLRAASGASKEIPPGVGIADWKAVEDGRKALIADPEAAQKARDRFFLSNKKEISQEGIGVVRAKGEQVDLATKKLKETLGKDSPEYKASFEELAKWDELSKEMQTVWHGAGQVQHGFTTSDGSFVGLARDYRQKTGKNLTPKQEKMAQEMENAGEKIKKKVAKTTQEWSDELNKEVQKEESEADLQRRITEDLEKNKPGSKEAKSARKKLDKIKEAQSAEITPMKVSKRAMQLIKYGGMDINTILYKLAQDFGVPMSEIKKMLAATKSLRAVTNKMWIELAQQRKVTEVAKDWVMNQAFPGWLKVIRGIPRAAFTLKIWGHGGVGMITHAGVNMFNPGTWYGGRNPETGRHIGYWPNFLRQYGFWVREGYHAQMMFELQSDPLYGLARRAGLANDPFNYYYDDYQQGQMMKVLRPLMTFGSRGFDALKVFRQDRFNSIWASMPEEYITLPENATRQQVQAQVEMARMVADGVNKATGTTTMNLGQFSGALNLSLFAPRLELSRWGWAIKDPIKAAGLIPLAMVGKTTPVQNRFIVRQFREKTAIAATYAGLLALNQAMLSAAGSNQKVNAPGLDPDWNPRRGDFMAFKIAGKQVGIISPLIGMVRLFAELTHIAYGERSRYEQLTPRYQAGAEAIGQYARGKFSPILGTGVDVLATHTDFSGRPLPDTALGYELPYTADKVPRYMQQQGLEGYSWSEYLPEQLLMIPVEESIKEIWDYQGGSNLEKWLNAFEAGFVALTGARVRTDPHIEKEEEIPDVNK